MWPLTAPCTRLPLPLAVSGASLGLSASSWAPWCDTSGVAYGLPPVQLIKSLEGLGIMSWGVGFYGRW